MIDYPKLIRAYAQHVQNCEGSDFLGDLTEEAGRAVGLNREETEALLKTAMPWCNPRRMLDGPTPAEALYEHCKRVYGWLQLNQIINYDPAAPSHGSADLDKSAVKELERQGLVRLEQHPYRAAWQAVHLVYPVREVAPPRLPE